ncbi:YdcF family protein [Rhizosaccharibacter radicis]|uniref:YdcF family protein n=1 Tax=Rhizosaccharibacter radicis TaxID=2782605 RepID=A0ABT1VZ99_9PROT|nr:YdcF family protein [Acetobacteraceae bacterium KSS12]
MRRRHGRPARRTIAGGLLAMLGLLAICWCGGFVWFAWHATRPPGRVPAADGIVVLTGGARRLDTALMLLRQDRARLLLISGVGEHLGLDELLRGAGLPPAGPLADRIALGHNATSTIGNAVETASWARMNGLHVLIVVTAGYHMDRALAEIGAALPDAVLLPYPVQPPAMERSDLHTLRLLAAEYSKWLAVVVGLTRSAHLEDVA